MDRRAAQGGGTFMDARRPGTMQQSRPPLSPPANIHLLPLLLTQIILQGNWVDYLPSQSVITPPLPRPPTPSIYLSPLAGSQFSHEAFECQVTLQPTAFPTTRPGRSKITRGKTSPR